MWKPQEDGISQIAIWKQSAMIKLFISRIHLVAAKQRPLQRAQNAGRVLLSHQTAASGFTD